MQAHLERFEVENLRGFPAAWCEAHHAGNPWAEGGRTDLADGVLLCSWHHHRIHDPRYDPRRLPDGDYRFHRRR